MILNEVIGDLFSAPKDYYLAHCISANYTLGAGIAKTFDEVYNMRSKLHKYYPIPNGYRFNSKLIGKALLIDNVFNLVTKDVHWNKPSYDNLSKSLYDMKEYVDKLNIKKLAMPRIGCGLDKLDWNIVKDIINEVFKDTDVEVVIYRNEYIKDRQSTY